MKKYVVAFLFTDSDLSNVWVIKKNKPEWQNGLLNGIGGKIEDGETPLVAMVRELKEEAGVDITSEEMFSIGHMGGTNNDGSMFSVEIFTGITYKRLTTQESEPIFYIGTDEVKTYRTIGNVPMLIEACMYRLKGSSSFSKLILEY